MAPGTPAPSEQPPGWQDYRGNTANDADALRVVTTATVTAPAKAGPRKVCVRVVDVFGFEAEVVTTVGAA